ncbi:MAG: hypothetical protein WAU91_14395 [Desulfatitalea sp.]
MKDPVLQQMRQWLPELFGTAGKAPKPGGMCTPESGCLPAADGAKKEIFRKEITFNEGLVQGTRTPENTTETAFEDFAQIFVQLLYGR